MSVIIGLSETDTDLHTVLFVWIVYCVRNSKMLNWDKAHTRAIMEAIDEGSQASILSPSLETG